MEAYESRIPQVWQEVKKVLNAHHIINFILSFAFFVSKTFQPICEFVFPSDVECGLDRVSILVCVGNNIDHFVFSASTRFSFSWVS